MDSSTLVCLAERELDYLTNRYNFLVSSGDMESADVIVEKGLRLSIAMDSNETFFCLPYLKNV